MLRTRQRRRSATRALLWAVPAGAVAVVLAGVLGLGLGAVSIPPGRVLLALLDLVPGVHVDSGLSPTDQAIVTTLRLPRVVLGLLVGALLAAGGASYQGVFRNPLADPYLLGVASGAGVGAIIAITLGAPAHTTVGLPVLAFAGAVAAVALTYLLGATGPRSSPTTLILAGVAVSAFLGAVQTFLLQRSTDSLREAYSWMLGRLGTTGWSEIVALLPYAVLSLAVMLASTRALDVLSVGDDEASSLGLNPRRVRLIVILAASLGTAAAVSFSGLIGFVGVIVPHLVRLVAGHSYRVIVPLSVLFGAAFLVFADVVARTVLAPSELPIGVVTAFCGAPFFLLILRLSRSRR